MQRVPFHYNSSSKCKSSFMVQFPVSHVSLPKMLVSLGFQDLVFGCSGKLGPRVLALTATTSRTKTHLANFHHYHHNCKFSYICIVWSIPKMGGISWPLGYPWLKTWHHRKPTTTFACPNLAKCAVTWVARKKTEKNHMSHGIKTLLAILCDLFGMVKWPFSMAKWAPTREWKGHFESPGSYFPWSTGCLMTGSLFHGWNEIIPT